MSEQAPRQATLSATRSFFAGRAAGWEERFPDDGPAFAAAVDALRPPLAGTALDAACGTGRALPYLRQAVGPEGRVMGVDITPEMLDEATRMGRRAVASLVLGDVGRLALPDGSVDAIMGAGLIPHLSDPLVGLCELARVTAVGGRLALFHPIGRAALAARHGHALNPDDPLGERSIRALLADSGWNTEFVDDGAQRYLVVATRQR